MTVYATIGSKALYLLFVWLLSAAGASWMADRKGYGERVGLTFGLVLTFVGFLIVLLLPGRPGSAWKLEGPLPPRRRAGVPAADGRPASSAAKTVGAEMPPGAEGDDDPGPGHGPPAQAP